MLYTIFKYRVTQQFIAIPAFSQDIYAVTSSNPLGLEGRINCNSNDSNSNSSHSNDSNSNSNSNDSNSNSNQ